MTCLVSHKAYKEGIHWVFFFLFSPFKIYLFICKKTFYEQLGFFICPRVIFLFLIWHIFIRLNKNALLNFQKTEEK